MTKLHLTKKEIYKKAKELGIGQDNVEYIERELETKMCVCGHFYDPGSGELTEDELDALKFCMDCGEELEENTNIDQLKCACCEVSLLAEETGYVTEDEKKGVCPECFEHIPPTLDSLETDTPTVTPTRMISPDELKGKVIDNAYFVKWNGAFIVETTDNCICATYADYDMHTGRTRTEHLRDVADFRRLCC